MNMKQITLSILVISMLLQACDEKKKNEQSVDQELPETTAVTNDGTISNTKNDDSFYITEDSFLGFTIGDSIHVKSDNIKKTIQESGEGSFVVYSILNENGDAIGAILPSYDNDQIIGTIEISSPEYKTKEGVHIGSTFMDLKNTYPGIETHGSEIESRTTSSVGGLFFLLDVYFSSYIIDESEIAPSTLVKKIYIQGSKN